VAARSSACSAACECAPFGLEHPRCGRRAAKQPQRQHGAVRLDHDARQRDPLALACACVACGHEGVEVIPAPELDQREAGHDRSHPARRAAGQARLGQAQHPRCQPHPPLCLQGAGQLEHHPHRIVSHAPGHQPCGPQGCTQQASEKRSEHGDLRMVG
jgi:hypothetical protein